MHSPFVWLALGVAFVAAVFDVRTARIPNRLTLGALLAAPFAHAAYTQHRLGDVHEAFVSAGLSLGGAALCAAVPLVLWRLQAIGGGDVKLIAAVGALAGPSLGLEATFYTFFAGAAFAFCRLAWRGTVLRSLAGTALFMLNPFLPKRSRFVLRGDVMESFRLGPAVCAGVASVALLHGGLS
jgi:prepilin peptidase CpaA